MRTRTRIGLTLVMLLLVAATGAVGKGLVDQALGLHEGLRLHGFLTWQHTRPTIAGGCDLPEQRQAAAAVYAVEQQVKRQLARLLAPRPAFAASKAPCVVLLIDGKRNLIVNAGEGFLVDAWQNLVELENMKFHGVGTGTTAAAEGDTALQTESTTALNPDSTRATGSLTEASASVFRTVGTVTFDNTAAITEWGLLSQAATGGGTLWSRVVFAAINVANGDSIQFTYDLTVEWIAFPLWSFFFTAFVPRRLARRLLRRIGAEEVRWQWTWPASLTALVAAVLIYQPTLAWGDGAVMGQSQCSVSWDAPQFNVDGKTPLTDLGGYGIYVANSQAALAALSAPNFTLMSPDADPPAGVRVKWPCSPLAPDQYYMQIDAFDKTVPTNRSGRSAIHPFVSLDDAPPAAPVNLRSP